MEENTLKQGIQTTASIGIKAVISAFPWIGGTITSIWSDLQSQKMQDNFQSFINELQKSANENKSQIDALAKDTKHINERILSLEETLDKVSKEWQNQKVPLYAKLFIGNELSDASIEMKIRRLEELNELSLHDLEYLQLFVNAQSTVQVCDITNPLEDIILSCTKLESRGLIAETDHGNRGMFSAASSNKWQDRWKHKFYTATPIGHDLIRTIFFPSSSDPSGNSR